MSEPDIKDELAGGIVRTTIILAVEITRQGGDGEWRISLPMCKQIVLPDGTTIDQPVAPVSYNFSDLAHDEAALEVYTKLRDLTIRIARGDLKPLPVTSMEPVPPLVQVEEPRIP